MNSRPVVVARNGLVTSGHPLASQAGLRILQDGGNAVDAAVAASAVLAVVRPFATGVGGDLFALIYEAGTRHVYAIDASGPAPCGASIDEYRAHGLAVIPERGPLSIETPGCVAGWQVALERFGRTALRSVLAPAIDYAERGFGASRALVDTIAAGERQVGDQAGWRKLYLPAGRHPRLGEVMRFPQLAATLRSVADGGAEEFYRGDLARRIAEGIRQGGGIVDAADLAACRADVLEPLSTRYRGEVVFEQRPPSQGIILLLQLAILDGLDVAGMGHLSADAVHYMVEAKKLAFDARLRLLADPDWHANPLEQLLAPTFIERCRARIDPASAAPKIELPTLATAGGDTTFLATADGQGNLVAMIQSLYSSWGSGVVAGDTGVLMTNRLAGFFLDPSMPNHLEPGKRTMHTLNTYMVFRDGRPLLLGGTPGTDDQVQINLQIISGVVDHELDLQAAHDAPRWGSRPGTAPWTDPLGSPYRLQLERPLADTIGAELEKRGHVIDVGPAYSIGSSKAIMVDHASGSLLGAADRRREGYAVGW